MQVGTPYTFSGTIDNFGGESILSMNMNYKVNGGPTQTQTISSIIGFDALTYYNWTLNAIPFTPTSTGTYTIKYWADNLNGNNVDQHHANDTLTATFLAAASVIPKHALYEEYTGQSCVFCMVADPNVDSVETTNAATSNIIRYHIPASGRDFMYNETTPLAMARSNYYNVTSGPE
jgi:hypothetical protein